LTPIKYPKKIARYLAGGNLSKINNEKNLEFILTIRQPAQ
jgi:hypothetical protein